MRVHVRFSLLALLVGAIVIASAPAAQAAAAPAIEKFVAVNCEEEACAQQVTKINLGPPFGEQEYFEPKAPTQKEAEEHGAIHAGQRVPFGITHFKVATEGGQRRGDQTALRIPRSAWTARSQPRRTEIRRGTAVLRTHADQRKRRMGQAGAWHERRRLPRLLRNRRQHGPPPDRLSPRIQ